MGCRTGLKKVDMLIITEMAKWGFEVVKRSAKKKTVEAPPAALTR